MTTVACVLVNGHVPFTSEYVLKLRSMVSRHMDRPFRFVCLSDRSIPDVDVIRIERPAGFGWWAKMELWRTGRFAGRVLYLDLDVLVVNSLAPILDYPADFALVPDGAPMFVGKNGKQTVKRYNSSVMVWDADCRPRLDSAAPPAVMARLWGDQDRIAELYPHEVRMPIEWFPRISECHAPPWPEQAKVILMKKPKNSVAAQRCEWMKDWWR